MSSDRSPTRDTDRYSCNGHRIVQSSFEDDTGPAVHFSFCALTSVFGIVNGDNRELWLSCGAMR